MAYNVANNLRVAMPDPIGVDQLKRKNVLADTAMQADQQRNALYGQQIAQNDSRMKADEQSQALERVRQWAPGAIAQARAGQIAPFVQAGQQLGVIDPNRDPATVTADEVEEFATQLGIGPAQQPVPFEQTDKYRELTLKNQFDVQGDARRAAQAMALERTRQSGPKAADAPKPVLTDVALPDGSTQKQWLTPGAASGTPVGAPTKPATGLSKTQVGVAKQKLVSLRGLTTQIDKVQKSFDKIKDTYSAGPGAKLVTVTEAGRDFDRAVALLSPLVRQLTRVPGEGAMSDYETKLAQMAMPTRNEFEGTTQQQINDLKDLITVIDGGTRELLGEAPRATGASGGWSAEKIP